MPESPALAPPAASPHDGWRPPNRFVPLESADLGRLLVEHAVAAGHDTLAVAEALDAIRDVLEQESAEFSRRLAHAYSDFNPDRETIRLPDDPPPQAAHAFLTLQHELAYLLDKANYERLSTVEVERVVARAAGAGLRVRVRPERVELLDLWVRGRGEAPRRRRTWRRPVRGVETLEPLFQRMAVVARLRDDRHVLIKLFKDIPEHEVEALLPHAEVSMTLLDRIKLIASGAGALGVTLAKLAGIAFTLVALSKVLWVVVVGLATVGVRTFFGYRNVRKNRDWQRTRRLYFQSLGNNASALQALAASVAQEEIKEAQLAYAVALVPPPCAGDAAALRGEIARFLAPFAAGGVDFDLRDAISALGRLGLWRDGAPGPVLDPVEATRRLRSHWSRRQTLGHHAQGAAATRAGPGAGGRLSS